MPSGPTATTPIPVHGPPAGIPAYDRDDWGDWIDADHDCQDSRAEVLITESRSSVSFTNSSQCTVLSGEWFDVYTGDTYTSASALDIDHVVPLANAYRSGAWNWSNAKKALYANDLTDPEQLRAVSASANRSKGDDGPESWKPPRHQFWCRYARDWIGIKVRWDLFATPAEWQALRSMLATCGYGTTPPSVTTPAPPITGALPANPGDSKNCADFSTWQQAQAWYDEYYPYYGDVAHLDADGDGAACESLPGAP